MRIMVMAAVAVMGFAGAAFADPAEGTWQTQVDDGAYAHVKMSTCGANLCGAYKGGKIWHPSTGKTFKSKMALSGNTLKVSGCVGPICRKQTWSRVN
jgi:uncharacterized protein (DUF2147 family)